MNKKNYYALKEKIILDTDIGDDIDDVFNLNFLSQ